MFLADFLAGRTEAANLTAAERRRDLGAAFSDRLIGTDVLRIGLASRDSAVQQFRADAAAGDLMTALRRAT